MGRIVGIDFGTVRIGLAISDERKVIAQSLPTLKVAKNWEETVLLLANALRPFGTIDAIVIGLPLLLSGKEGEMATNAKAFGSVVNTHFALPIIYWDERLTSAQVDRVLKSAMLSRKKRAQLSDQLAAVTILQNYLDSL